MPNKGFFLLSSSQKCVLFKFVYTIWVYWAPGSTARHPFFLSQPTVRDAPPCPWDLIKYTPLQRTIEWIHLIILVSVESNLCKLANLQVSKCSFCHYIIASRAYEFFLIAGLWCLLWSSSDTWVIQGIGEWSSLEGSLSELFLGARTKTWTK